MGCLLVSTIGSISIGVAILGTDYDQWDGAYAAKAQLPILIVAFLLRAILSIMIVGALLFGQFTGKDGSLCCCTCILAPLTLFLPLGVLVGAVASKSRDIESQPADASLEKEGLLEAPLQKKLCYLPSEHEERDERRSLLNRKQRSKHHHVSSPGKAVQNRSSSGRKQNNVDQRVYISCVCVCDIALV